MRQRNGQRGPWGRVAGTAGVIGLALATAACSSSGSSSPAAQTSSPAAQASAAAASTSSSQHYKFGFVQILGDPFFTTAYDAAKQVLEAHGDTLVLTGPSQFSVQQQVSDTESLVTQGVNGIILSAADPAALIPAVQEAKNAGIPTVLFESKLANNAAVDAADSETYAGGEAAGKYMCSLIGNKGQVAVIGGTTGEATIYERWYGFKAAIKANCSAVQVVATEITNNNELTAKADTSSLLAKYPKLAGFFADNIVDAQGVAQGATSLGTSRPKIVAFDAEPAEVQLLQQGKVDALIAQQPVKMGQVAAQALLDAVAGKTVKPTTIPTVLITKDTLAENQAYVYHS